MANSSKRKGTAFESAVVAFLEACGVSGYRPAPAGPRDKGDIHIPGWGILECKATREIDLAAAVDEAECEAANADADNWAAVVKRRRRGVGAAYVVMPLWRFVDVIADSRVYSEQMTKWSRSRELRE